MSIWSSMKLDSDTVWSLGYAPPGAEHTLEVSEVLPIPLDLATATPWYGDTGLRLLVVDELYEACVVLPRDTARAIRDAITAWLDSTEQA